MDVFNEYYIAIKGLSYVDKDIDMNKSKKYNFE